MTTTNTATPKNDPQIIGFFEKPGEYFKDFFFLKDGETYHLVYNRGEAGPEQSWLVPGNEDTFGHASSTDLWEWTYHEPVMAADQGDDWEGMVISAPCIQKVGGVWKMLYTGFSASVIGKQAIGLAESDDLTTWRKFSGNPVYTVPDWAMVRENGWCDCRDPHFLQIGDRFVMYASVLSKDNEGAIAIASSSNLVHWQDHGVAFTEKKRNEQGFGRVPESPVVFEHQGKYFMLTSQNQGFMSDDPFAPAWTPFPFDWPKDGFYAGFEVVCEEGRQIGAAFNWKMDGNFIKFWEFQWRDGLPWIAY